MPDLNDEIDEVSPESGDFDTRATLSKTIAKAVGAISLCLSLIATINFASSPSSTSALSDLLTSPNSTSSSSTNTSADTTWVPAGFTIWSGNPSIAWRWSNQSSYSCSDYGCVSAEFVSNVGCPSGLYAAINWLDAPVGTGGSVVSYANATLPSLQTLQVAKLKFDDIEGTGKSAQMATITCY
jgi:hypothetical protein